MNLVRCSKTWATLDILSLSSLFIVFFTSWIVLNLMGLRLYTDHYVVLV